MDTIADFISQLKNASHAGKKKIVVQHSNFKQSIAEALKKEGFVYSVSKKGKKNKKVLEVEICSSKTSSTVNDVKRVSKPSRRFYKRVKEIYPKVHQTSFFSTPQGILTAKEAKEKKVGGEEIFRIW